MELFFQYLVFGITLAISIGPVNLELIKRGVSKGFLPSWLVGLGGMTADFIILYLVYFGLGAYFNDTVQFIFGCVGSILLIYIGLQSTRTGSNKTKQGDNFDLKKPAKIKDKQPFATGFLLAIANPLNFVFWLGINSSLLTVNTQGHITTISLIVSIFLGIAISNILLALLSSMGKAYVKPSNLRFISLTSGIVIIGYGFWIGYTTISSKVYVLHFILA